ncbi:Flavoprotein [Fusarium oxysporum f. sp. vasinfectum]|nr:Flavoprotein [Fusarium oxysporum f. sp. vasinfectum]
MAHHHSFSPRLSPALTSTSSLHDMARNRKLRLLVAATGPRDTSWAQALVVRLSKNPQIEARAIVDDVVPRLTQTIIVMQNRGLAMGAGDRADDIEFYRQQAFELVEWADLMVCVPLDADSIAKMLAGVTDTFLGEVLRGWDTQKSIVLVPGMSTHMWSNPMTKKHLSKLHRKWNWIRVVTPILWHYEGSPNPKRVPNWNGFNEVLGIIKNQADLLGLGRDVEVATGMAMTDNADVTVQSKLPPEIWTIILDYAGDWELAKALGMYTNLPMPSPWTSQPRDRNDPLKVYEHELEWTVLTCNSAAICKKISQSPPEFHDISALVIKLVIKFGLIDVLAYMEANRPDLFKAFDGTTLPTKASAYYPRTDVLDYWKQSAWFRDRHVYDAEAVDGASKFGHSPRWSKLAGMDISWFSSGGAMQQHRTTRSFYDRAGHYYGQHNMDKLMCCGGGDASGIPAAHGDSVAKMASRWGQVEVLETWRRLKGDDKLVFDAEVLVSPTIFKHLAVLEWWRNFAHGELEGMEGRKQMVEFRTCNIEEALEDSIGDQSAVRRWWTQNGLNLGLRDEEWLKTRYL